MLTRDQILARTLSWPTEVVPCPELGAGATLRVKTLNARDFMDMSSRAKASPDLAYAHWIVATVVDDEGKAVFQPEDAATLANMPFSLIARLTEAAQRLNGTAEQAEKNSTTRSSD